MMTEDTFLARLFQSLPTQRQEVVVPPGDDCAAIAWQKDKLLLLAVDQVIGDRHYLSNGPQATPPRLAGRKLLARNMSDVAAMGGKPTLCLLAGAFAPERQEQWLQEFYAGIVDLAAKNDISMIGGDLAVTPHDDVASLTILGEVAPELVVCRNGARPGDYLLATGSFGDSFASQHHLLFEPRCAEGQWLAQKKLAKAMIDVSDGLLLDAQRLCEASKVGLIVDLEAIPRRGKATLRQACGDGEDFELLFAVAPGKVSALQREWPFSNTLLTVVGQFVAESGMRDKQGQELAAQGWDHFGKP